ncbi:MAG: hypothetical protein ACQERS_11270 [Bacteroidota bacterium]
MIDGLKILNLPIKTEALLNNENLDFHQSVITKTGELSKGKRWARFKGLKFTITNDGICQLKGSIHKYYNDGVHNYDDFHYKNLIRAVRDLIIEFNIDPRKSYLNGLEFGVNIRTDFNPKLFLDNIQFHTHDRFKDYTDSGQQFYECEHSQYSLKAYDKGLQHKLPYYLLRFEIRVKKMAYLKNLPIRTLWDLLDVSIQLSLRTLLIKEFDRVLYWDPSINKKAVNEKEWQFLRDGTSDIYWREQLNKPGGNTSRLVKRYITLVRQYGSKEFNSLKELIVQKSAELINYGDEEIRLFTGFKDELEKGEIRLFTGKYKNSSGRNNTNIYNLNKGVISVYDTYDSKKVCPVTGIDISGQKECSKFLSYSGVEKIYETDRALYEKLSERLSDRWEDAPLKDQFVEIAHSVRNEYNNLKRSIRNIESKPSIFDNMILIRESKRNLARHIKGIDNTTV